jgi:hypothetical protein
MLIRVAGQPTGEPSHTRKQIRYKSLKSLLGRFESRCTRKVPLSHHCTKVVCSSSVSAALVPVSSKVLSSDWPPSCFWVVSPVVEGVESVPHNVLLPLYRLYTRHINQRTSLEHSWRSNTIWQVCIRLSFTLYYEHLFTLRERQSHRGVT